MNWSGKHLLVTQDPQGIEILEKLQVCTQEVFRGIEDLWTEDM